jgi:hypothetical protein
MKANIFVIFIALVIFLIGTNCNAEMLKSNVTAGNNLDAHTLFAYGREFNDSLITMIGRIIENYHVCTAWSKWSECGAKSIDFYSTKTRTRRCGGQEARYGHRDEIEASICEGSDENNKFSCPVSYHTTTKGFCLKLYMDKKSYSDAEAVCKSDGGFLVNIDSDQKYDDIKAMLIANNITVHIFIDGMLVNSKWNFSYGSMSGYFHWYPGYPRSTTDRVCLAFSGNRSDARIRFRTFNSPCSVAFNFVCEIPRNI